MGCAEYGAGHLFAGYRAKPAGSQPQCCPCLQSRTAIKNLLNLLKAANRPTGKPPTCFTGPKGVTVERIPKNVHSKSGDYNYSSSYRLKDQRLYVQRSYITKPDTPFCQEHDDKYFSVFLAVLRRYLNKTNIF